MEPVPVYKFLTRDNLAPFELGYRYSYGMNTPYGYPDYQCTGRSDELSDREPIRIDLSGVNPPDDSIYGGYLHAYMTPHPTFNPFWYDGWDAAEDAARFKMVKMYIPVGAGYWIGVDGDVAATALYWESEEQ
jgi:hypothetical protein